MLHTVMQLSAAVAHDFVLDLLPAEETALDEHLVDRAGCEAGPDEVLVLLRRVGDAAAGATERIGGPDHQRQAHALAQRLGLLQRSHGLAVCYRLADLFHERFEQLSVLGVANRFELRAEEPDPVALQHAGVGEGNGEVEAGLAPKGREKAVRLLAGDDALDHLDGQGLDVDDVGGLLVGHDRGRVGVDEDREHAFFSQGATGLGAGVIELRRLPDDDRPGTENEDLVGLASSSQNGFVPLSKCVNPNLSLHVRYSIHLETAMPMNPPTNSVSVTRNTTAPSGHGKAICEYLIESPSALIQLSRTHSRIPSRLPQSEALQERSRGSAHLAGSCVDAFPSRPPTGIFKMRDSNCGLLISKQMCSSSKPS